MRRFQASQETSSEPERGAEKRKRWEFSGEDAETAPAERKLIKRLTESVERGSRLVAAQLEAQTIQQQIDREQRKEQFDGVVQAFHRLADAVSKIADKL